MLLHRIRIPLIIIVTLVSLFQLNQLEFFFRTEIRQLFESAGSYRILIMYSLNGFIGFVVGAIPFVLIEMTSSNSRSREKLYERYAFPLIIWACYYVISNIVVIITALLKKYFSFGFNDLSFDVPLFWHIILYVILIDFFGYWLHRLEHKIPFLWRFHSTHHSLKNITAFNQYGHWFEGMFRFFIVYLPVSLLISVPDFSASSLAVIWGAWTLYIHTDSVDLCLPRWARYIFVDNLYHHYHHGYEKKYHDKNFSGIFSLWDIIFRTCLMPKNRGFPKTGLHYLEPPSSILEYIFHPFNRRQ